MKSREGRVHWITLRILLLRFKRKYSDPFIVVAGNFNHWKVGDSLANFDNLKEVHVGNTRGNRAIDRVFTNVSRSVVEAGTMRPLESEGENDIRKSDHLIVYCKILLNKQDAYRWETYSYRHFNERSVEKFRDWVVFHDWADVLEADTPDGKAEAYQRMVVGAVEKFFPLRTVRKKSSDPPWLNKKTRDLIDARKRFYLEEGGRTAAWKLEKMKTEEAVGKRKRGFLDIQRDKLLRDSFRVV